MRFTRLAAAVAASAFIALAAFCGPASAQVATVVASCPATRPTPYPAGTQVLLTVDVNGTLCDSGSSGGGGSGPYPTGATAITASAVFSSGTTTATLSGTSGKTTYICGWSIRANATAASNVTNTIVGLISGTMSRAMWVAPLASGIGLDEMIFQPTCIPASAANTAITVNMPAIGSGGFGTVNAWGYQL